MRGNTVPWTDWNGKTIEINVVADARNVVGLAGYPWLIIAANPQLSNHVIELYLATCGIDGVGRSPKKNGATPNQDGHYARALQIMWDCPTVSNRKMVHILKSTASNGVASGFESIGVTRWTDKTAT